MPLPDFKSIGNTLDGRVLLKVGDKIHTNHIMPAGAKFLGGSFTLGGDNYSQGSSHQHSALAPKYLGVEAVIVKSLARIHIANVVNFGILPLTFAAPADYDRIELDDELELKIGDLSRNIVLDNKKLNRRFNLTYTLFTLDRQVLKADGKLPWVKSQL